MQQIFPTNPQWNHIRFRIQLIVADPSVELVRVTKFNSDFDQRFINHMKIDCAYNATEMSGIDLDMIKFNNPSRYVFEAGRIRINNEKQKVYRFLFFKLAINQTMPIHKSGASELSSLSEFPQGMDTIYVSENKQELNIYPHKYRVKDKSQCCLEYEIEFTRKGIDTFPKWDPQQIFCEFCETSKAAYYCIEQKEVFCGKCYEQMHRSSKKKSHKQCKLTPFNTAALCSFHPKQRQIYYCFDCMALKCEKCIQNQAHQKKHKQIMGLLQLEETLKQKEIVFIKETKQKTKSLILKAEEMLSKISKKYDEQKRDLQQSFTIKLSKIRDDSNKKLMRVVSLHAQLKRKFDEVLWAENFLHFCQQFMLAQDNIQMNDAFFVYLQSITTRDYFNSLERGIEDAELS